MATPEPIRVEVVGLEELRTTVREFREAAIELRRAAIDMRRAADGAGDAVGRAINGAVSHGARRGV